MIHKSILLRHYKQKPIQEALVEEARDKEIAVKFSNYFGKRPDVLRNPADVLELAKKGATSFHASEERWSNPLQLSTEMSKHDMDQLRIGWDLVLDIDCAILDYSKIAAKLVIGALKHHGISSISCKFSGNKGFHIGIPYEAFPKRIGKDDTYLLFPEAARRTAMYLQVMIKPKLGELILEADSLTNILKKTGKTSKEVQAFKQDSMGTDIPYLDVEPFLNIDTILISSRHLYRMSYSFNEKSGLLSIPIDPKKIDSFTKDMAEGPKEFGGTAFLGRKASSGEARDLLIAAFDHAPELPEDKAEHKEYELPEQAIPELCFPPCIKHGFKGMQDGKKRFLFALTNFMTCCGWDYDLMEKRIDEWNKKNPQHLRPVMIKGHLRYHKSRKQKILPPNCRSFYQDLRLCHPDNLCERIKNPVSYARRRGSAKDGSSKPKKR
ncbi:MAG: hypothetical protein KJ709_08675 [Nanoarchaeota archaeon]|nr:hypothetical protein [Nanoarchaeota archaeon]